MQIAHSVSPENAISSPNFREKKNSNDFWKKNSKSTAHLPADGEDASTGRIHENDFAGITGVGAVRVDSEDELAFAVVSSEAVAGEEKRGFPHGEMSLLLEQVAFLHNRAVLRHCFRNRLHFHRPHHKKFVNRDEKRVADFLEKKEADFFSRFCVCVEINENLKRK